MASRVCQLVGTGRTACRDESLRLECALGGENRFPYVFDCRAIRQWTLCLVYMVVAPRTMDVRPLEWGNIDHRWSVDTRKWGVNNGLVDGTGVNVVSRHGGDDVVVAHVVVDAGNDVGAVVATTVSIGSQQCRPRQQTLVRSVL